MTTPGAPDEYSIEALGAGGRRFLHLGLGLWGAALGLAGTGGTASQARRWPTARSGAGAAC